MEHTRNKALARRWSEELWSAGRLYVADAIVAPGYIQHDPGEPVPVTGPAGVKRQVAMVRAAIPDLRVTVEALIAERDHVVARCTIHGTAARAAPGEITTGPALCVTAISIFRIVAGQIAESWTNRDDLGLWQQLAVLPAGEDKSTR